MTIIRFLVIITVLFSAMPAKSQFYTNYPTLDTPAHFLESYYPDIRVKEDQTQAAVLLILLNLLDPRNGISQEAVVPLRDLRRIGLSRDVYKLSALAKPLSTTSLINLRLSLNLQSTPYALLLDQFVRMQRDIARNINNNPTLEELVTLAAISLVHPDPLVRITAAPLVYILTIDGKNEALAELKRGSKRKDNRLSLIASTLLARLGAEVESPKLSMNLRRPSDGNVVSKTTLVIHGTWASESKWWRNGYPFFEYLEHDIPFQYIYTGNNPFKWSGEYSHKAREQAALELADWAISQNKVCLNIVAHSHGANVGFLASKTVEFGRMILLSTPAHPNLYSPHSMNYESLLSLRVHLDLVILADGGGNEFPGEWSSLKEKYIGWFNHSATHYERRWEDRDVPNWLSGSQACL